MATKILAKVLFPQLPVWQARRQARQLLAAFVVAVIVGGVIGTIIMYQGFKH